MREQKTKIAKIGVVCQNGKGFFFGPCLGFGGFVFLVSLCFCASVLYTIAQNGYFLHFQRFFVYFVPQKACLKLFIFFLFFLLSLLKNPFFSLLFVHQPLFRKDSLWGFLLFFFCFPFPFLMFACLFETNYKLS